MAQTIVDPDETMTGRVFSALSPIHQSLLWNFEVERLSLSEVTKIMGLVPKDVVIQLSAARLRFCNKWTELQSRNSRFRPTCQQNSRRLRAYAESRLNAIERSQVQSHLKDCFRCAILVSETRFLATHLRIALRPQRMPDTAVNKNSSHFASTTLNVDDFIE